MEPTILKRIGAEGCTFESWKEEIPEENRRSTIEGLSTAPIILIETLADYFDEWSHHVPDHAVEFQNVAPIFPLYFLEGRATDDNHVGIAFHADPRDEQGGTFAGWDVCGVGFIANPGRPVRACAFIVSYMVDAHGQLEDDFPDAGPENYAHRIGAGAGVMQIIYRGVKVTLPSSSVTGEIIQKEHALAQSYAIAAWHMVSSHDYFHVKNITLQTHMVSDDHQKRLTRRLGPRDGGYRYHTLVVNGIGRNRGVTMSLSEALGTMPLHKRRGCWRNYTADRPLFGNPKLVGKYFSPSTMVGKKENGVVEKHYSVRAPATEMELEPIA